ncbi:tRNA (adenine(22)-N(1))-methyltransferase [Camelliibacillus cellulosilyticus]|uniref:tRNA (Adenine(22)-N(1))-methyltransferase n=1 Tax=Camelliibacillus cellulosilyticus TaxID=2174486 RepID=A0ABV9GJ74_9BACL
MKQFNLSKRLKTIASYIPRGSRLADIGSDHAYLPVYLVLEDGIEKGIAGEINDGPLKSAMETVRTYGLEARIDVRKGNGLSVIKKGEVDAIAIAGMGGELIRTILDSGRDRLTAETTLVLQPNVAEHRVREWLEMNGWTIDAEEILEEDDHIYEVIVAKKSQLPVRLTALERRFGPFLLRKGGAVFERKWRQEQRKLENILQSLEKGEPSDELDAKKTAIQAFLQDIKEVIQ